MPSPDSDDLTLDLLVSLVRTQHHVLDFHKKELQRVMERCGELESQMRMLKLAVEVLQTRSIDSDVPWPSPEELR